MSESIKPIRILHVLGGLDRGGAETMVMNWYRAIDKSKVQFDFVIHTEKECAYNEEIRILGGKIYSCPRYNGKNHFTYCRWWKEFLEEHAEYQIVHAHIRSTAAIILQIAKKKGCFTISHSHSTSSGSGVSAVVKNVMQYPIRFIADYFFACSDEAGEWLFGKRILKSDNYKVINNAIDIKRYEADSVIRERYRSELGIGDKIVIGNVGRLHPAKNHRFLLDIFEEWLKKEPNSVLLLVGDGEEKNRIIEVCKEKDIMNQVLLLGSRGDIPELLQAMDIFVFPSLWEGFGMALIEAQAAGLPVVASNKVPLTTRVSGDITYLALEESLKVWIAAIESGMSRKNVYASELIEAFDITKQICMLQKFYLEI